MKPLLSVVVPVYNVEEYLEECLTSLARQSLEALEVVVVDDGSTDGSRAIVEGFAARDGRFRCVHQPNAGLSAARNTGVAHTTPGVPYLAFADSDDLVVPDAYERMLASLESTGSDLVTGNVWRLTGQGPRQAWQYRWLTADHPRTHVTRDPRLLADRVAWNKVFRRSFWDRHAFVFPVGKLYEDAPVMIPAHHLAGSVDVLHEHVYLWRVREGSITRRRTDVQGVRDRIAACEQVSAFLADRGAGQRERYDASCLRDDFVYFLEGLPMGGPAYRTAFMADAGAFLDRAGDTVLDGLPAEARIRWRLVRERRLEELLAVLAYERDNGAGTFAVRGLPGRRRAVHPGVADGTVGARLGRGDLPAVARLVEASWGTDGRLTLRGYAYIRNLPATAPRHALKAALVREAGGGRPRAVPVRTVRTPGATADSGQETHCYDHAGFEMVLDPARLGPGRWLVGVVVASHSVLRRAALRAVDAAAAHPLVHDLGDGLRAVLGYRDGRLALTVTRPAAVAVAHDGGTATLELTGRLLTGAPPTALVLTRDGAGEHTCPVRLEDDGRFTARVPLAELAGPGASPTPRGTALDRTPLSTAPEPEGTWRVALLTDGARRPLAAAPDLPPPAFADPAGDLVVEVSAGPLVDRAEAAPEGGVRVSGTGAGALLLRHSTLGETVAVLLERLPGGRFTAVLAPPPREGDWELYAEERPVRPLAALAARLPLNAPGDAFRLDRRHGHRLAVRVPPPLTDSERGAYRQGLLRTVHHPAQRALPLRDAVLYTGGDSPRAVHAELVRRSTEVAHLWVTDGSAADAGRVPPTAVPVVAYSTAWYEALARSRRIVTADPLPTWFTRRRGQTVAQTWHGTPLGRFGLDLAGTLYADHQQLASLPHGSAQWSFLVSPSTYATPLLRRALAYGGEVLEAGSPANDLLSAPGREKTAERVRRQLAVPDGHRVVLYAPTYRDQLAHPPGEVPGGWSRAYRWEPSLDPGALSRALDARTTLLVRRHPRVTGGVPDAPGLRDVTAHPDTAELLLIADVLVTDYAGLAFDFALTGRPMLFHTHDLEHYRDTVRGFCLDFEARAPGPLLVTTDEVAQALRTTGGSARLHADAYDSFRRDHCDLDDGGAARRVVDRLLADDGGVDGGPDRLPADHGR
ncbi:CDP-glycerol glycerophosphotransferase family protein [Streptomyces sp. NBC_01754]|uniref:bifunctional glycosyltransferase/CDP-glycerol:glycerophosphate glycerophosphotransferase n=1 Tax=Streptomyces sp. NBC_01754 TaxID=2975930 RepID=UPI002DD97DD3|nr:CDP-glycerol glycerophosphotransferase family protein [Streptomyces sp. NBC_01754]WSC92772.1 CDP-glycerol glycerophosphotransferase family protein [Streptomyces sp. NBC_01754]